MNVSALVLDDEAIIAADIARQLNARDGWHVQATTSVEAARDWLRSAKYDVLFLDIEMPGCDGLTFAAEIKQSYPDLYIIFSTAYPQHAAKAFRLSAVDYIVKPLSRSVLAEACSRIEDKSGTSTPAVLVPRFIIKSFGRTDIVDMDDIIIARAERNYVALVCKAREYLHRMTISDVEKDLVPLGYLRCHRSFIVRKNRVKTLVRRNGVLSFLRLDNDTEIPVGANYRAAVQSDLLIVQKNDG